MKQRTIHTRCLGPRVWRLAHALCVAWVMAAGAKPLRAARAVLAVVPAAASVAVSKSSADKFAVGAVVELQWQGGKAEETRPVEILLAKIVKEGPKGYIVKLLASPKQWPKTGDAIDLSVPAKAAETAAPVSAEEPPLVTEPPATVSASPHATLHTLSGKAKFRVLFDLVFTYRPGVTSPITFDSYHNVLWIEYTPSPAWKFSAEVSPSPRFFEIGYSWKPGWTLRLGRLWIPFDDLGPHSLFGGRANISKMSQPSSDPFLPDVWTDLGIGVRGLFVDSATSTVTGDLYVVNGFAQGGTDPMGQVTAYPSFSSTFLSDNNYDKAVGARLHGRFQKRFGIGVSGYRGRFSDQAQSSQSVWMVGLDGQVSLTPTTELRAGYVFMSVNLGAPSTVPAFRRGGLYAELGQSFSAFKFLLRGGQSQNDSRVAAVTDQSIVGGALLYRPGAVQLSIEHSRDLNSMAGKNYTSFTGARVVAAF